MIFSRYFRRNASDGLDLPKVESVPVSRLAAKAIEGLVVNAYDPARAYEEEPWAAEIRRSYVGGSLRFLPADAGKVVLALVELAMAADEIASISSRPFDEMYRQAAGEIRRLVVVVRSRKDKP
jgi:hypothetical protein